jgi:ABC-2 type transport system ATP-binding protein
MPVLTAGGAGVRHRRRWLFRDLDVAVEPGEIVAVVGPPGSGRTTLLLALAGRFRLTAGTVTAAGPIALGYVPDVTAPEPVYTVAEHVRERLALQGRPRRGASPRARRAADDVDLRGLDPRMLGRDLSPFQRQVLGIVLAGLAEPAVIALDGFDDGLDAAERAALWRLITEMAGAGTAVILTAREVDPAAGVSVIRLGAAADAGERAAGAPSETETSPSEGAVPMSLFGPEASSPEDAVGVGDGGRGADGSESGGEEAGVR